MLLPSMILAATVAAQPVVKDAPPAAAQRTTRSGVYTAEQAKRGAEVYAGMCKSCHTPASHTGVTFAKWWKGHPLSDLLGYVGTKMPKNDPGGLDASQYADVVAYLLRMNAMPAGLAELPTDPAEVANVRIVTGPAPAAKRPAAARRP